MCEKAKKDEGRLTDVVGIELVDTSQGTKRCRPQEPCHERPENGELARMQVVNDSLVKLTSQSVRAARNKEV